MSFQVGAMIHDDRQVSLNADKDIGIASTDLSVSRKLKLTGRLAGKLLPAKESFKIIQARITQVIVKKQLKNNKSTLQNFVKCETGE